MGNREELMENGTDRRTVRCRDHGGGMAFPSCLFDAPLDDDLAMILPLPEQRAHGRHFDGYESTTGQLSSVDAFSSSPVAKHGSAPGIQSSSYVIMLVAETP
jgi:hypothetical protein